MRKRSIRRAPDGSIFALFGACGPCMCGGESSAMLFDVLVVGYVRANALRALATVFAIALGVGVAIAAGLAQRTIASALARDVGAIDDGVTLRVVGNGGALDERVLARVEDVAGVASVRAIVDGGLVLGATPQHPDAGEVVRAYGVDLLQPLPGVATGDIRYPGAFAPRGSYSPEDAIARRGIVLSHMLAQRLHAGLGTQLDAMAGMRATKLRVLAILPREAVGVDAFATFIDLATAQPLFDSIAHLDRIDIVTNAPRDAVRARIAANLPANARVETVVPRAGALGEIGSGLGFDLAMLSALALLAGALLACDAIAASVARRRGEIGTLRALGVTRGQIFWAFVAEGASYGTAGALAGLELGAFGARYLLGAFVVGDDAAIGSLAVAYDWGVMAFLAGCGVVVAGVAAAIPARAAAQIAPAFAAASTGFAKAPPMRGLRRRAILATVLASLAIIGAFAGVKVASSVSIVLATTVGFPALVSAAALVVARLEPTRALALCSAGLALGRLDLRAGALRSSIAATSLAVALGASIALSITATSLRGAIETWAVQTFHGDLVVRPLGFGPHDTFSMNAIARATAVPGVARIEFVRSQTVAFGRGFVRVRGEGASLPSPERAPNGPVSQTLAPAVALTPAPATVSERFAARYHVQVGSTLALPTPSGSLHVRVASVRVEYADPDDTIAIDARRFARAFGDSSVDAFSLALARGANLERVRRGIFAALAPLRLDVRVSREERDRALAVFDRTFAIARGIGALVLLLALAGISNALAAFVLERKRELAMLRYVGATRGVIRTMMLGQAAFVGGLGTLAGLGLGVLLSFVQLRVVDLATNDQPIAWQAPAAWLVLIAVATFAAALVAALRPAHLAGAIAADAARGALR